MLVKDKDILIKDKNDENDKEPKKQRPKIKKEHMREAWGDAFDTYIRGVTENYILFRGRSTRLEFWGFGAASGLIWFTLYFLGVYAEMPLLAYWFALATIVPTVAIAARRLHDTNHNASLYLSVIVVLLFCGFFIGIYATGALVLAWSILLIRMFSRETELGNCLYGAPKVNDEIFEEDNILILNKFRFIALVLFAGFVMISCARFDDWRRQAEQRANIDLVMERVIVEAQKADFNAKQIDDAQKMMKNVLREFSGKPISEEELAVRINKVIKSVSSAQ